APALHELAGVLPLLVQVTADLAAATAGGVRDEALDEELLAGPREAPVEGLLGLLHVLPVLGRAVAGDSLVDRRHDASEAGRLGPAGGAARGGCGGKDRQQREKATIENSHGISLLREVVNGDRADQRGGVRAIRHDPRRPGLSRLSGV